MLGRNWLQYLNIEVNGELHLSSQDSNALNEAKERAIKLKDECSDVFCQDRVEPCSTLLIPTIISTINSQAKFSESSQFYERCLNLE